MVVWSHALSSREASGLKAASAPAPGFLKPSLDTWCALPIVAAFTWPFSVLHWVNSLPLWAQGGLTGA